MKYARGKNPNSVNNLKRGFKKGHKPWNLGKSNHLDDETRLKMSSAQKNRFKNQEPWNKGKKTGKLSEEHLFKLRGENNHNFGKKLSDETKEKIRLGKTGKKNPNWKGGIYPIAKELRTISKYKEWRKSVFERDDYTCQDCSQIGGTLNVDHINPMSLILRKNNITNYNQAIKCNELWDINNGRTLCVDCHKKTDTFGFKLCQKKQ